MNVLNIVVIFILFCIVWLITQIVWKSVEAKLMIKYQNARLDALYLKVGKLIIKAINDSRDYRDMMRR